jgi:hypothetical protein
MRLMTAIETSIAERMRRIIGRNYYVYSIIPNNISHTHIQKYCHFYTGEIN